MTRTSRTVRFAIALAAAGAAALAGGAAAGGAPEAGPAAEPVTKKVKVGDNFFKPARATVPKNSKISWKWLQGNGETHDVLLVNKPKGVKKFQSAPAATDFSFRRKLRKPGKYFLVCTFHEEMTMNIKVKG